MTRTSPGTFTFSRQLNVFLLASILAIFVLRNLPWHLDDYDQAKQAFVSFEMVKDGHWWFQHTPTGRIATKPPLAGWISAALHACIGHWELAWRIPPFFCALILLGMIWRSARNLASGIAPIVAVSAFALNLTAPRLATLVRTDMMLTLFIFVAGWMALEKVRTGTAWTTRERLGLGLAVLASMLTKGPILYAFLLPGLAAFAWLMRRRNEPNRAWSGWQPWLIPLLFFAAWAGIGIWLSRDFYEQVVLKEFLGRFDMGEVPVHKHQPVLFYVGHLFGKIWNPWSLALVALLTIKRLRSSISSDRALLWLACWALGGLVLMSLVPSKRPDRIFPVIPPLCLLLGALAQRWVAEESRRERIVLAVITLAALIAGGYTLFSIVDDSRHDARALVHFGARVQELTATNPERLAIVGAKDEGLLLYTNRTRFVPMDDAINAWRRGELNWLVVRDKDLTEHQEDLGRANRLLEVPALKGKQSPYYLVQRPGS